MRSLRQESPHLLRRRLVNPFAGAVSRPKIWIFCELYYPEEASTGYHLTGIAEALAAEFEVHVITGPASQEFQPVAAPKQEERHGVHIHRCRGTHRPKDSLPGRLLNMLTRTGAMWLEGLRRVRRGDTMLVVTNPPLLPFAVMLLKWLRGAPFVFLMYDVYPEVLVASGLSRPNSWLVRLGQLANRLLYRQADRLISIGRDMSRLLAEKLRGLEDRLRLIPNWAELESITCQPPEKSQWRAELELQDKFTVLYAGTIGRTHGVETIVAAAERLREHPGIHILVAGFGAKETYVRQQIDARQLPNLSLHHFNRPRREQGETLAAGDVGLISFMPGMSGVSVPSRMYNFMAAGRALIAVTDAESELAMVVREEQIGWVVPPNDGAALAQVILEAQRNPETVKAMGERAAAVVRSKYSQEKSAAGYRKLFAELTGTVVEPELVPERLAA